MKKKTTFLVALLIFPLFGVAQSQFGANAGIIKPNLDNSRLFIGGEVYAKREITEAVRGNVNIGFYNNTEVSSGIAQRLNSIPITIGVEYLFLQNNIRPYAGVNVGLMMTWASNSSGNGSFLQPMVAPQVGVDYKITERFGVNLNFKYGFVFSRDESTPGPDFVSFLSPNIGVFYIF